MNVFFKKNYQYIIFILCFLLLVCFTYRRHLNYLNEMDIDKVCSVIGVIRILLMDKQYGRLFGFVYPNMISFITYFLIIIFILWILEENKNFKSDEYSFVKYRLSKIDFINRIVVDVIKKTFKIYICFLICLSICAVIGNFSMSDLFITIIYLIRLSLLNVFIFFIRQSVLIFYKNEKFVIYQYFILLGCLIFDMYLDLELLVMSSDIIYEFKYILILMVIMLFSYLVIKKLYIGRKEYL